jgi:hypothetical protein
MMMMMMMMIMIMIMIMMIMIMIMMIMMIMIKYDDDDDDGSLLLLPRRDLEQHFYVADVWMCALARPARRCPSSRRPAGTSATACSCVKRCEAHPPPSR